MVRFSSGSCYSALLVGLLLLLLKGISDSRVARISIACTHPSWNDSWPDAQPSAYFQLGLSGDMQAVAFQRGVLHFTLRNCSGCPKSLKLGALRYASTVFPKNDANRGRLWVAFYGPTMFAAWQSSNHEHRATFEYIAAEPGEYLLHVASWETKPWRWLTMRGSPIVFLVTAQQKPSVHAFHLPKAICPPRLWPGRWVPCSSLQQYDGPCLPDGSIWVPFNCSYKIWKPLEILSQPRGTWIVFAGSSVTRGIFFSLVDLLFEPPATVNLTRSAFYKCWGWLDLKVNHLRLSYQDMRTSEMLSNPAYKKQALSRLRKITSDGEGPSVIFFQPWDKNLAKEIQLAVSNKWRGKFLFGSRFFAKDKLPGNIYSEDAMLSSSLSESIVTGHAFIPVMPYFEGGLKQSSNHFHYTCNKGDQHICGIAAHMALHMILGSALQSTSVATETCSRIPWRNAEFCLDCPPSLLPLHVKEIATPDCFSYIPQDCGSQSTNVSAGPGVACSARFV